MACPGYSAGQSVMPRIPGFKVQKLLGKGSYGKVYKAERESDKQLYAIKEADLGAMSQAERSDAVNEVRLLVSINHVNVIRYHEALLLGNKLCTVMEFAPFGDLRYYITKGAKMKTPFPEEAIWRIFLQLCRGLSALHANNVIHRDIKPANIFLCDHDLLKIGDLGIAKALTNVNFARTQIGTPCYMAPEVWSGRPYSYSSDMWSTGAVLYEMMTFKVPMEGRSMQDLRARIVAGRYAPVPPGRYSQELVAFCHALLSADPKARPSPASILNSSAAAKWMRILPEPSAPVPPRRWSVDGAGGKGLLDTIIVPRDLKQLPKKLPPPSYDNSNPSRPALASAAGPSSVPVSRAGSKPPTPSGLPLGEPLGPSKAGSGAAGSAPNSRAASREGSRAPSPGDIRAIQDNRQKPVLPPLAPRVGSAGNLVAAAQAAAQAYQQRWTPYGAPQVAPLRNAVPPQRRVSYG